VLHLKDLYCTKIVQNVGFSDAYDRVPTRPGSSIGTYPIDLHMSGRHSLRSSGQARGTLRSSG